MSEVRLDPQNNASNREVSGAGQVEAVGPWEIERDCRSGMSWNIHIVSGEGTICFMANPEDEDVAESNALLVRASPEMRDALRECQSALSLITEQEAITKSNVLQAYAKAVAAAAKARAVLSSLKEASQ